MSGRLTVLDHSRATTCCAVLVEGVEYEVWIVCFRSSILSFFSWETARHDCNVIDLAMAVVSYCR